LSTQAASIVSSAAKRQILVTSALPYANGPIHLGHMVEAIQTDIWVRFQKSRGHECYYVCADDAHGTPIMIRARQDGIDPEELIAGWHSAHVHDYQGFLIQHDSFHSTHSEENRELSAEIYSRLKAAGHITRRVIEQAYDAEVGMFLPDRFIKGNCPRCDAPDQYGDNCEVCGATYTPTELKNPVSVLSNTTPERRESEHLFFRLGDFEPMLREWTRSGGIQPEIANKLDEWFSAGLQDCDISRDAPHSGFEIPDQPRKYFYVWLDAPIGYMASFRVLCRRLDLDFDAFWGPDSRAELVHFIGKDIAYFHTLFWPAMLQGAGFRRPDTVHVHGFLTVNGQKMSKSRGTFVLARTYLEHLEPEYFRYYIAAKLGGGVDDIDMNLEDFVQRVNSDLVGKVVNIASRCASFLRKGFGNRLAPVLDDEALLADLQRAGEDIAALYERREYGKAIRSIMALADRANQYIDTRKPWVLARDPEQAATVQAVCSTGINLFRVLMTYLAPVLPAMADKARAFLRAPLDWTDLDTVLLDHALDEFQPLMARIDAGRVDAMVEAGRSDTAASAAPAREDKAEAEADVEPIADEITIDDFNRIDLRVAEVLAADFVEGADKLLGLRLNLGSEERQVFAGIRAAYAPEDLVGRLVVVVANLAPRKMRFGVSQGMVLCAGPGGEDLWLLAPDSGARPGMRIR
jgi:methionyl-tRNA synthetase